MENLEGFRSGDIPLEKKRPEFVTKEERHSTVGIDLLLLILQKER